MDYSDRNRTVVYIGSDHGGFNAKEHAKVLIKKSGYELIDLGTFSEDSVDYPDFGVKVARAVSENNNSCGVIFCGTGIGISISANKIKGIRAALCTSEYHAEMARRHNDANIVAMGGRVTEPVVVEKILDVWFKTPFDGGRHETRVEKIHKLTEC